MKATRRATAVILGVTACGLAVPTVPAVAATPGAAMPPAPRWRNVPTPAPLISGALNQVDAVNARTAWAVGVEEPARARIRTAVFRWNGSRWSRQPTPVAFAPTDVTASGPRRAWILGLNAFGGVALHWNGIRWAKASYPAQAGLPNAVAAAPDGSAWAAAANPLTRVVTVLRWAGGRWVKARVPLPANAALASVGVRSKDDVWLAGSAPGGSLIMHWNGRAWRRVAVPRPAGGAADPTGIARILPVSAANVWALRSPRASALLHWNGRAWTQHPLPGGIGALSVTEDGRGGAWVVPYTDNQARRSYYLHWNGRVWTKAYGPPRNGNAQLGDIDRLPGGSTVLGVGAVQERNRRVPFTESYG